MASFEVHLEGGVGPLPSETEDSKSKYDATTYKFNYKDSLKGRELIGRSCPSCGSQLVVRINSFDDRKFVACDKQKKRYCKFSIGLTETLKERTIRVKSKLDKIHIGAV